NHHPRLHTIGRKKRTARAQNDTTRTNGHDEARRVVAGDLETPAVVLDADAAGHGDVDLGTDCRRENDQHAYRSSDHPCHGGALLRGSPTRTPLITLPTPTGESHAERRVERRSRGVMIPGWQ